MDLKFTIGRVPAYIEQVGFAADLAVFNVLLAASSGFIHKGLVPLPAPRTLVARISDTSLHSGSLERVFLKEKPGQQRLVREPRCNPAYLSLVMH
jgi:hypothetical protein